jgi:hypothetical protein
MYGAKRMNCPVDQVEGYSAGDDDYVAKGCGKWIAYRCPYVWHHAGRSGYSVTRCRVDDGVVHKDVAENAER